MSRTVDANMRPASSLKEKLSVKGRRRRDRLAAAVEGCGPPRNDLLPKLQVVDLPMADIRVPSRNVRMVDQAHVDAVGRSIDHLGLCAPLILGKDNVLIDGVVCYTALQQRGISTVPCIRIEHLSSAEQRQLRLAFNRLGEKGDWSVEDLRIEFAELIELDIPVEITGFDLAEIDHIMLDDTDTVFERGELEPRPEASAVSRPGDRFELGSHRVICGDARDPAVFERLMQHQNKARLVLTDQPYNVKIRGHVTGGTHREFLMASGEMSDEEFAAFTGDYMRMAVQHLCDGGIFGTFIDWRSWPTVHAAAIAATLTPMNLIVWQKTNAGMGSPYRSQHELLPLFRKGTASIVDNVKLGRKGRWRSNLWTYPGASSLGSDARKGLKEHPTVKPTAMLEDAILDLTNRGDVVIDPFLGSGSTLIAAERCGRICLSVELDPLYVDVICRRYQAVTGKTAMHSETSLSFEELAALRAAETPDETVLDA